VRRFNKVVAALATMMRGHRTGRVVEIEVISQRDALLGF
jgi:hypothetical protein